MEGLVRDSLQRQIDNSHVGGGALESLGGAIKGVQSKGLAAFAEFKKTLPKGTTKKEASGLYTIKVYGSDANKTLYRQNQAKAKGSLPRTQASKDKSKLKKAAIVHDAKVALMMKKMSLKK